MRGPVVAFAFAPALVMSFLNAPVHKNLRVGINLQRNQLFSCSMVTAIPTSSATIVWPENRRDETVINVLLERWMEVTDSSLDAPRRYFLSSS